MPNDYRCNVKQNKRISRLSMWNRTEQCNDDDVDEDMMYRP